MTAKTNKTDKITVSGAHGTSVTLEVLLDFVDEYKAIRVTCSTNHLKVFLEYKILKGENLPRVSELEDILVNAGINFGINHDGLTMAVLLLEQEQGKVGPIQVANGIAPQNGENGHIDFLINPYTEKAQYKSDTSGKINYHETYLIDNAYSGSSIAIIRPPQPGKPGKNIFGQETHAANGSPLSIKISDNITLDANTGYCKALTNGYVSFKKNTLSIIDEYIVAEDVNLTVGNINFVGMVIIKGNVLDDFSIRGGMGVTVEGVVGACKIWSEKDINLKGGVAGKGKAFIKSEQGWVRAKYINETKVESQAGVVARNEIVNSNIFTKGPVLMENGTVIGGKLTALRGIEVGTAGSNLGTATFLSCGLDWTTESQVSELQEQLEVIDGYLDKLGINLKPLMQQEKHLQSLPDEAKALMKNVLTSLKELREKRQLIEKKIAEMRFHDRKEANYQINIIKLAHAGTVITIDSFVENLRKKLNGPAAIVLNKSGIGMKIANFTALSLSTNETEQRNTI